MRRVRPVVLMTALWLSWTGLSHASSITACEGGPILIPSPSNSSVYPATFNVSPYGGTCDTIIVRDLASNPICGVTVSIDFSGCQIEFCDTQSPDITINRIAKTVTATTDSTGRAIICLCACVTSCMANVYANGVLIAMQPVNHVGPECMIPCEPNLQTCAKVPTGATAWFPFKECSGSQTKDLASKKYASFLNGAMLIPFGHTGCGMVFPNDYSVAEFASSPLNNFGTGSFSVSSWIRSSPGSFWQHHILTKGTGGGAGGYYLRTNADELIEFALSDHVQFKAVTGSNLEDGQWHYVVATVNREPNTTFIVRLYVDGVEVNNSSTGVPTGSVSSTVPLYIGNIDNSSYPTNFNGTIDDVQLFNRCVPPAQIAAVYAAGAVGQCSEFVYVPWFLRCRGEFSGGHADFYIGNYTSTAHTYETGPTRLPAGTGCTVDGPPSFFPLRQQLTVAAGSQTGSAWDLEVPHIPEGGTACFRVSARNLETGYCFDGYGKIRCPFTPWWTRNGRLTDMTVGLDYHFRFDLVNIGSVTHHTTYKLIGHNGTGEPIVKGFQINGQSTGVTWIGAAPPVTPGDSTQINFTVKLTDFDPFEVYTILLEADTDSDGQFQPIAIYPLIASADDPIFTGVGDQPLPAHLSLSTFPNPTRQGMNLSFFLPMAGQTSVGIYDVSGRLVRQLQNGVMNAGVHSVVWSGTTTIGMQAHPGIYFVRLSNGIEKRTATVVLLP